MTLSRWQTVEDGAPRTPIREMFSGGGAVKHMTVPILHPYTHATLRTHMLITASQITGAVSVAPVIPDEDDGA